MTIDDAFEAAIKQLDENGELVNIELFRLVEHNTDMLRQLRKRLISEGFAEDQWGTGLKAIKRMPDQPRDTLTDAAHQPPDTRIAVTVLSTVPTEDEIEFDPPIRFSESDFLPLGRERPEGIPPQPVSPDNSVIQPQSQVSKTQPVRHAPVRHEQYQIPVPVSPGLIASVRPFVSRFTRNKLNLCAILLFAMILAVTSFQWRNSVDAHVVYQEFIQYYDQAKALRSRAVRDPVEWQRAVSQSRSRVKSIVNALRDVRTGASAQQPEKQELLWAGNDSLSKFLESPEINKMDEEKLRTEFEFHMSEARRLLDGGTRTMPQKQIAPGNTPGAGRGYLGK